MVGLLPEVHGFLVFGMGLEEKNVDKSKLLGISVSLKLLTHSGSDRGYGHGHVVHGLDLGRSSKPFAVRGKDSTLRISPIGRLRRLLSKLGRRDGHGGQSMLQLKGQDRDGDDLL